MLCLNPNCTAGKFIGACTAISGVLVIALPIPIVVNNFAAFYNGTKKKARQIARRDAKERWLKEEAEERRRFLISIGENPD